MKLPPASEFSFLNMLKVVSHFIVLRKSLKVLTVKKSVNRCSSAKRSIIAFALDKGADVAIAILSLVMQMKLGM